MVYTILYLQDFFCDNSTTCNIYVNTAAVKKTNLMTVLGNSNQDQMMP